MIGEARVVYPSSTSGRNGDAPMRRRGSVAHSTFLVRSDSAHLLTGGAQQRAQKFRKAVSSGS